MAALVLLALASGPGLAESPDAFVVRDVEVDRTATTAAQAREQAVAEGERLALRRLLQRLTPRDQSARLAGLGENRIAELIDNFEVQSERTSAVRYIGAFTFRFKPNEIRGLLRDAGIPFAETAARPLVVLPLLQEEGGLLLWEDTNAWRVAWSRLSTGDSLAPLIAALGDLADITEITAAQADAGDEARIAAFAGRYGAAGAIVAKAQLEPAEDGRAAVLHVSAMRVGGGEGEQTVVESFTAAPDEAPAALMVRAAAAIVAGIEDRWKSEVVLQFDREARLVASVELKDIGDWIAVRQRLAVVAEIRRYALLTLTRTEAIVELHFIGEASQLRLALAQRDLSLAPLETTGEANWRLALGRAGAAGVPARP
ncbi:MAG: DUF2066 domain-containing protein [Proteobacteria bacterium]|nr:DUF2066 domain-containing protein [Pseudomonadota bacterium]